MGWPRRTAPGQPLRADDRPRLVQRRPHRRRALWDRRRGRVVDLHLAALRPPAVRRSQQVGLHRRQHRRTFPFEDPRHDGRGLAGAGGSDQSERSPVPTAWRLPPDPPCWREPLGWWCFGGNEAAPKPDDDQSPWDRPSDEERLEVPTSGEPWSSINPEGPALRRADLRTTDPVPRCSESPRRCRRRDPRAQPVEQRPRQHTVLGWRPGRGRTAEASGEPRQSVSRSRERDALRTTSEQEREKRPRPDRRDDRHRDPSDNHDRQLESTEPIAFHTPVGRNRSRKPRR